MRLIDADAMLARLEEWNTSDSIDKALYNFTLNRILEQPTMPSSQLEIIHCKDCKHWREGTAFAYCDKLHGMGVLDALDYMTAEDDYCSMVERRTDERTD